jgi:peptide/nickel transport system substrate-binding protein
VGQRRQAGRHIKAAVFVASFAVLAAACTSSSNAGSSRSGEAGSPTNQASDKYVAPANADPNATLRLGAVKAPTIFDPAKSTAFGEYQYMAPIYDRLVQLSPSGLTVQPMLATSWKTSADGLTWTFTMRTDAKFADGTAVNADAVKLSFDRVLTSGAEYAKSQFPNVIAVKATGADTVTLTLSKGNTDLLPALASHAAGIVCPSALAAPDALASKPCGSGPYELTKASSSEASYTRRTGYWDPEIAKSAPAKLILTSVADQKARINGLRSDQFDAAMLYNPTSADVSGLPASIHAVLSKDSNAAEVMLFNFDQAPLSDSRVREAINMAVDRKALASLSPAGVYVPTAQMSAKGTIGYSADLNTAPSVDIEAAKKLLAAAGYASGFSTKLMVVTSALEHGTAIQAMLKKIGINAELDVLTSGASTQWRKGGDGIWLTFTPGSIDPAFPMGLVFGSLQQGKVPVAVANAMANALTKPVGSPERNTAWQEFNKAMSKEGALIFLNSLNQIALFSDKVLGTDKLSVGIGSPDWDPRYLTVKKS